MPYTSANGHMFSQLNKAGEIGIHLPKETQDQLIKTYQATPFMSYGATMKDYVLIPDDMLKDIELAAAYLEQGLQYVNSLEPK